MFTTKSDDLRSIPQSPYGRQREPFLQKSYSGTCTCLCMYGYVCIEWGGGTVFLWIQTVHLLITDASPSEETFSLPPNKMGRWGVEADLTGSPQFLQRDSFDTYTGTYQTLSSDYKKGESSYKTKNKENTILTAS